MTTTHYHFLCAMICISMARNRNKRKHLAIARFFAKKIQKWAEEGNPNVAMYNELVKAELAEFETNYTQVERCYDKAILLSGRRGMISIQAISHERRAEYFLRRKPPLDADAKFDIQQAQRLYKEWGALRKVSHLEQRFVALLGTS